MLRNTKPLMLIFILSPSLWPRHRKRGRDHGLQVILADAKDLKHLQRKKVYRPWIIFQLSWLQNKKFRRLSVAKGHWHFTNREDLTLSKPELEDSHHKKTFRLSFRDRISKKYAFRKDYKNNHSRSSINKRLSNTKESKKRDTRR